MKNEELDPEGENLLATLAAYDRAQEPEENETPDIVRFLKELHQEMDDDRDSLKEELVSIDEFISSPNKQQIRDYIDRMKAIDGDKATRVETSFKTLLDEPNNKNVKLLQESLSSKSKPIRSLATLFLQGIGKISKNGQTLAAAINKEDLAAAPKII